MKKLLFIALVGLAVVSCKKEEEETPTPPAATSIEGNWTSTAQSTDLTVSGTTFALDANGDPIIDMNTFLPVLTDTSYTQSEQVHPDSLDPKSMELLSNGNCIFTDMDNYTDTLTYEHVGSNLNLTVPEGAMDGSDTTVVFNIQNLTSSALELQIVYEEQSFTDADMGLPAGTGIDFVMTYSVNWSFSK